MDEIEINGTTYVPKGKEVKTASEKRGMKYIICRTYSAGVFAGYLESRKGKEVILRDARRLWYWSGASSLSQLAVEGVKNSDDCKFPCEVDKIELMEAIEIIEMTKEAQDSIKSTPIWKQ